MTLPIDFTSQDYLCNPAAGIGRLRAASPVVEVRFPIVGKTWVTTMGDAARQKLKFSKDFNRDYTRRRSIGAFHRRAFSGEVVRYARLSGAYAARAYTGWGSD